MRVVHPGQLLNRKTRLPQTRAQHRCSADRGQETVTLRFNRSRSNTASISVRAQNQAHLHFVSPRPQPMPCGGHNPVSRYFDSRRGHIARVVAVNAKHGSRGNVTRTTSRLGTESIDFQEHSIGKSGASPGSSASPRPTPPAREPALPGVGADTRVPRRRALRDRDAAATAVAVLAGGAPNRPEPHPGHADNVRIHSTPSG